MIDQRFKVLILACLEATLHVIVNEYNLKTEFILGTSLAIANPSREDLRQFGAATLGPKMRKLVQVLSAATCAATLGPKMS